MIVARKPVSIAQWSFKPGDRITRDAQKALPPGRMQQMLTVGYLEELLDEVALERRVEALEAAMDDFRGLLAGAKLGTIEAVAPERRRSRPAREPVDVEALVAEIAAKPKRPRGRPRKAVAAVDPIDVVPVAAPKPAPIEVPVEPAANPAPSEADPEETEAPPDSETPSDPAPPTRKTTRRKTGGA